MLCAVGKRGQVPRNRFLIGNFAGRTRARGCKKDLRVWHACHTVVCMKMTMHIDEDVLADVVKITGVESKTKAVEKALTEMVRRYRLKELGKKGLGLTAEELRNAWEDPF